MSELVDDKKQYTSGSPVIAVTTEGKAAHHIAKQERDLDLAATVSVLLRFFKGATRDLLASILKLATGIALTPEENKKLLRKIDWHILPPMMFLYLMQFWDKVTLGNSVLLGVKTANHLTTAQYNLLSTIFYVSYLIFELPQNWCLQRFPVARWMGGNICLWAVFLMLHAACHNFGGLFAVRFLLGICEGSITAGFLILTSQYYTRVEQGQRVGMWFLMNGSAQCVAGLISYGIVKIPNPKIQHWQILFLLAGSITFCLGVFWILWIPDSSTTAWFLTPKERGMAIERIRANQTGAAENKHWKKDQFIEALTDVKVWLFVLFSLLDNIPNSLTNQSTTLYTELGYTTLTNTLLGIPSGVIEIVTIGTGIYFLGKFPNSRCIIGCLYLCINVLSAILVITLPWSNKHGILVALYFTGVGTTGFVISLSWLQATTAGHTKRTTAQGMNLVGYCVGNAIGPQARLLSLKVVPRCLTNDNRYNYFVQVWQAKFAPRNFAPWGVVIACYGLCPVVLLCIRYILVRRNNERELERESGEKGSVEELVDITHPDGTVTQEKVDKGFLDFTDKQNRDFVYCL